MKLRILFLIVISFYMTGALHAQMFSVDDRDEELSNPNAPYLRGGLKTLDIIYTGSPQDPDASALNTTGVAAFLAFEAGGLNLAASLGNRLTGIGGTTYFDFEISFINPFMLIRRDHFRAGIPVQIGSKLTAVRNNRMNDEFSQTNLSAGAGALAQFHYPKKLGVSFHLIPAYGFSTASGGFVGGNVFSLKGKARLIFFNLIFNRNVSFGYDYTFDSYDIEDQKFDYDFTGHTITIGISL